MATIPKEIEVESFRTGLLTSGSGFSREYTEQELDEILESLNEADPRPVVIGHPRTDSPAYGWIAKGRKYFKNGAHRLSFSVGRMRSEFAQWLEDGHYRKVSVALWRPDDSGNPTPGKWALRHLGFLGAAAPAIPGLEMVQYSVEDSNYFAVEYGTLNDKAAISGGFRSLATVMRSFREWVISENNLETADKLIPSYLVDDLEWTAGRLMQSTEEEMKEEMGVGYSTDPLGADLTPDQNPSTPKPEFAMTTQDKTPDTQNENQNAAPAKDTTASESVNFAAENARLSAENATLQAKNDALEARFSALEERLNQQQANAEKAEAVAFAQQLISDRKIMPAKKGEIVERIMAFDNTAQITFSADAPAKTQRQIYMDTLAAGQPLYSDDQILSDDQPLETEFAAIREAQQKGFDKDSLSDDLQIQSYMKEHGGYTIADMRSTDSTRRDAACALYAEAMNTLNIDYTG